MVDLSKGKRSQKNKWVYKLKHDENNLRPRYKVRLVVKGFNQKKDFESEEIFSPELKVSPIWAMLGLASSLNLDMKKLDVNTAFLHGDLEE